MTTETRLRDAMADAVAPVLPDTDRLVSVARRRGLGIRRRRQALASVGVAVALGVTAAVPAALVRDHGGPTPAPMSVGGGPVVIPGDGPEHPLTGRSVAAALLHAVGLEQTGAAAAVRGSADTGSFPESYVVFRFTPSGSDTAGEVGLNLDSGFTYGTTEAGSPARMRIGRCEDFMTSCVSTRLPDGSRLTTYDDRSDYGSGGVRRVAQLYRPDIDLRVVVSASNGVDVTELAEDVTRAEPVLTRDQLVAIVTQPWWGPKLPAVFTEQGKKLADFSDRSARASGTPTPAD